jgi:hypothetical protein
MTENSGHIHSRAEDDSCGVCSEHSGITTWVKIGLGGISLNIALLVVSILLNISISSSVSSINADMVSMKRDITVLQNLVRDYPAVVSTQKDVLRRLDGLEARYPVYFHK